MSMWSFYGIASIIIRDWFEGWSELEDDGINKRRRYRWITPMERFIPLTYIHTCVWNLDIVCEGYGYLHIASCFKKCPMIFFYQVLTLLISVPLISKYYHHFQLTKLSSIVTNTLVLYVICISSHHPFHFLYKNIINRCTLYTLYFISSETNKLTC